MPWAGAMLPTFTGAFIAGLGLGSYLPFFPLLTVSFLIALALFLCRRESTQALSLSAGNGLYAALLSGLLYWHAYGLIVPSAPGLDDVGREPQEHIGTVVEPVQHAADRATTIVQLQSEAEFPQPRRIRLTWRDAAQSLYRGDHIAFQTSLRRPHGPVNPRGFDYASYLERQGIGAVATVSGPHAVRIFHSGNDSWRWVFWNRVDQWREQIRIAAVNSLGQPALGLFLSLIIGERGYLATEVRDWFMATGTVHVLSISGSHLGLVAMVSYALCRRLLLLVLPWTWLLALSRRTTPTRLAALWTLLPVTAYAILAGAETATMRSLLMVATGLLAVWCGYRRHLLHALCIAAIAILLHDPRVLFDISFQLSFLSVWSIAWYVDRHAMDDAVPAKPATLVSTALHWLRDSLVISLLVTTVTLPLVAFYFNQLPWVGLATNLLVVPFTGLLIVPIGLCAACWLLFTSGDVLPFAAVIDSLSAALVYAVHIVADVPHVEFFVAAPTVPVIALFYWLGYQVITKPEARPLRIAALSSMIMVVVWWIWSPRPFPAAGTILRATFLDVGQGDSAVVELPDGQVVVIDGGAASDHFDMGRSVVAPYLWNRGIRRVDHVVGTHPQLDHVGGLTSVVEHFAVGHVWSNGLWREEAFWKRLEQSLDQKGLQPEIASEGVILWADDDCRMEIIGPDRMLAQHYTERGAVSATKLTDSSVVIDLSCGQRSLVFAADLERAGLLSLLDRHDLSHVTILKVPHHGARSSFDRRWVASIHPDVAVFSVGARNPYRHPAREVVKAYEDVHASIARTDRDGAVWVELNVRTSEYRLSRAVDGLLQPLSFSQSLVMEEAANVYRLWRRWNWQ